MAQAIVKKTVTVHLILDVDEAQYLLGLLQNDPYGGSETDQGKAARTSIYEALERELRLGFME